MEGTPKTLRSWFLSGQRRQAEAKGIWEHLDLSSILSPQDPDALSIHPAGAAVLCRGLKDTTVLQQVWWDNSLDCKHCKVPLVSITRRTFRDLAARVSSATRV